METIDLHIAFDLLAMTLASAATYFFKKHHAITTPNAITRELLPAYLLVLIAGLILGSLFFGSLNLYLSGVHTLSKSFAGGLAGAVVFIELFKRIYGIKGSTGHHFIPGLCLLIIVGRLGCFSSGLDDFTHGSPTDGLLAIDFGDGIFRHPVRIYECLALSVFLALFLTTYKQHQRLWVQIGFYIFILYYSIQRLMIEFLKPYSDVFAGLNLFQILCIGLIIYALYKIPKQKPDYSTIN